MIRTALDHRVPVFFSRRPGEPAVHVLWAMCLFLFSVPFESIRLDQSGVLSVSRVAGYLFFAAALTSPRLCFRRPSLPIWCLVGYFYILVASVLQVSPGFRDDAFVRLTVIIQVTVATWIISNLMQYQRFFTSAMWALGIGSFGLSLLPHLGFGGLLAAGSDERVVASGFDPNVFGSSMVLGCVAMVSATQGRGRVWWHSVIAWVLTLATAYMIVKSGSRGALLSLVFGVSLTALAKDSAMRTLVRVSIVVAAILGVVILVLESESMRTRFERTLQSGDLAGRQYLFIQSFEMFKERPILGWGPIQTSINK